MITKAMITICLAIFCLVANGQTNALSIPRDVWVNYLAMSNRVVVIEAQQRAAEDAWVEENRIAQLKRDAEKINSTQLDQARQAARTKRDAKLSALIKERAELKLKQMEIQKRYKIPTVTKSSGSSPAKARR